ncbi:hypothetical protein J0A67_05695 [Algoriphagus aestuariicola]|jgi:hypothetical protein|uniref:Uncharacterized protein n=1 Tax=Algoriphagus aestuariicola TaxID=1852016 RepID=A0ABS3BNF9_9BACT|nr:DUF6152 family protein [Algoriphagus aestuariicola]MBN7800344.1 hypothetical protein [Algoriphagus aestuariicola]
MIYLKNSCLLLLFLLCVSFGPLHHGWANYDQTKVLDFETTIDESTFGNPHTMAKVNYQDEPWTVYLAPASRMTDRGLSAEMIKKGTKVRLVAYPHKTEKGEMRAERIYVDGKKYELR